jgi:indole-3-glycerol phosphate synthase
VSFLEEVVAQRRRDVAERAASTPLSTLREKAARREPARDFAAAIRRSGAGPAIIGEFKRSSPSAGVISSDDVREVAKAYERGGASALSVLTEPRWFAGDLADIDAAKNASGLPVLRKDFIVDAYQVVESAAAGADGLLLIVTALSDVELEELRDLTESLGLQALVEVHDEAEAERAVCAGARIIGINNRDLRTLAVDMQTAARVRPAIPPTCLSVAESGYTDAEELERCAAIGFDAVLVGERLLRAADRAEALRSLRGTRV